jgi:hypothetical protein
VDEIDTQLSKNNKEMQKGESYSSVLRDKSVDKRESVILITSNEAQVTRDVVKEKIVSTVDPEGHKISGLINLQNNKVLIKSKGDNIDKLVLDLGENLGAEFNVKLLDNKLPKVKIVGLDETDISDDQIVSSMRNQNEWISENNVIKIVKKYVSGKNKDSLTLIAEVDIKLHKLLLDRKTLHVQWNGCRVYDATQVTRCFKCSRLSHIESECKIEVSCPRCSGPHKLKECKSEVLKCVNCCDANEKHNLKLNTSHAASDPKCETMLRVLKRKIRNVKRN